MMGDLQDLFESVDGLTEDLVEFGTIAGAAVATNVAFNFGVSFALEKWTTAPEWFRDYVIPGIGVVGGALAGAFGGRYVGRRVATGVAVGLMSAGITRLVHKFAPAQVTQYLGAVDDEVMLLGGLGSPTQEVLMGGDAFGKYLGGSAVTVEQVNGLGRATASYEPVNGLGNYAATFQ